MRYLNPLSLLASAVVAAAVGWSLDRMVGGPVRSLLILPWLSLVAEAGAALVLGYLGLRVRAYRNPQKGTGRRRDPARRKQYDPVWAVGTAAAAAGGGVLVGDEIKLSIEVEADIAS